MELILWGLLTTVVVLLISFLSLFFALFFTLFIFFKLPEWFFGKER